MVLGNVPKLHGFIALLAGVCAVPVGCSGDDFSGCEATRTCPSKGGTSGTGGEAGGGNDTGGNDAGGSSGSSTSGTSGTAGTAGTDNGGEGGMGPTHDTERPTIVSFSPDDGDVDVERDVAVTATFSEPIDAASVTETNVVLTGPDGDVPGTLSVDGEVVSFVPERKLYLLGEYSLTIGDGVADLAGNTLGEEASVGFRVRDGRWSEPTFPFGETVPRLITEFERNALGDVVLGMERPSNSVGGVFAAVYAAGANQWSTASELRANSGARLYVSDLGIDSAGRAIVAWQGTGAGHGWSRFVETDGWVDAGPLDGSGELAVTPEGTATVFWWDSGSSVQMSKSQDLSTGTIEPSESLPTLNSSLRLRAVPSANRLAVFGIGPVSGGQGMTVTWRTGPSWGSPEPLASAPEFGEWTMDSDEQGNVVVVWHEGDEIRSRVYQRADDEWTRELLVATVPADTYVWISQPDMTAGNAVISFNTFDPDPGTWVAIYEAGVGWVQSSIVRTDGEWTGGEVGVAIDKNGCALATWHPEFKFARYTPDSGWSKVSSLQQNVNPYYMWASGAPDGTVLVASNDTDGKLNRAPWVIRFE